MCLVADHILIDLSESRVRISMADDDSWLYGEDNEEEQEESREAPDVQEADVVKGEILLIELDIILYFYNYTPTIDIYSLPFLRIVPSE